jgi:hypothetical protein
MENLCIILEDNSVVSLDENSVFHEDGTATTQDGKSGKVFRHYPSIKIKPGCYDLDELVQKERERIINILTFKK